MLKFDQPRERKAADLPTKGPQTQSTPEGGRKTLTMMIMMMIVMMIVTMTIMTMMIIMYYLCSKGPETGLVPGGA